MVWTADGQDIVPLVREAINGDMIVFDATYGNIQGFRNALSQVTGNTLLVKNITLADDELYESIRYEMGGKRNNHIVATSPIILPQGKHHKWESGVADIQFAYIYDSYDQELCDTKSDEYFEYMLLVLKNGLVEAKQKELESDICSELFRDYDNSYIEEVKKFDFSSLLDKVISTVKAYYLSDDEMLNDVPRQIVGKLIEYLRIVEKNYSEECAFWDSVFAVLSGYSHRLYLTSWYLLEAKEFHWSHLCPDEDRAKTLLEFGAQLGVSDAEKYLNERFGFVMSNSTE